MTFQNAYSKLYELDAMQTLGTAFDYAVNDCHITINLFGQILARSHHGIQFERGNPAYLSGMSGIEFAVLLLCEAIPDFIPPAPEFSVDRSPDYWMGWALARFQRISGMSFSQIFSYISPNDIRNMYPVYHEMDLSRFEEEMKRRIQTTHQPSSIRLYRKALSITQKELAKYAGVPLRSIQMYEQNRIDISKAQAGTLLKLARVLHCSVEKLIPVKPTTDTLINKTMRCLFFIFVITLMLAGCTKDKYATPLKRVRLEEPSVAIISLNKYSFNGEEGCRFVPLKAFLPPCSRTGDHPGIFYYGAGTSEKPLNVTLLGYEPDPSQKDNIILKFEVVCNTEVYDIPEISWNQEDTIPVMYGDSWRIMLTHYEEQWNEDN